MSNIVLYDLPSKGRSACWSYNPWKVRLALNYKGLDYETEWTEFPDIEPKLKAAGVPPSGSTTSANYTIPTARFENGEYIMDSRKIAAKLDELQPSTPLYADSEFVPRVEKLILGIMNALGGILPEQVFTVLLNPASVDYFEQMLAKRLGMPTAQFMKENPADWEKAAVPFREIGDMLRVEKGPFLLGDKPSFADFIIVGALQWLKRMDEGNLQKAREIEPALGTIYDACSAWLVRDD